MRQMSGESLTVESKTRVGAAVLLELSGLINDLETWGLFLPFRMKCLIVSFTAKLKILTSVFVLFLLKILNYTYKTQSSGNISKRCMD